MANAAGSEAEAPRAAPADAPAAAPSRPTWVDEMLVPMGGQLTLGSTLGFCSGYALRIVGRAAAVGVGGAFMFIQGLAYTGYIQVDWRKVEKDYLRALDKDGDGKVTARDFEHIGRRTVDALAFNLPAGAGFTAGLAYGMGISTRMSLQAAMLTGVGGRIMLSRVAIGGLGLSSPGAVQGVQEYLEAEEAEAEAAAGAPLPAGGRRPPAPGYCLQHFLGEGEDRCLWSPNAFASRWRVAAGARGSAPP